MTVKPNDGAPAAGGGMTIPRDGRVPSRAEQVLFFCAQLPIKKVQAASAELGLDEWSGMDGDW